MGQILRACGLGYVRKHVFIFLVISGGREEGGLVWCRIIWGIGEPVVRLCIISITLPANHASQKEGNFKGKGEALFEGKKEREQCLSYKQKKSNVHTYVALIIYPLQTLTARPFEHM